MYDKTHGWVFEVPAARQASPKPLTAMGLFVHEAVAVDRQTGIIYETEDRGTSGFYQKETRCAGQAGARTVVTPARSSAERRHIQV